MPRDAPCPPEDAYRDASPDESPVDLPDERATAALGARLAESLQPGDAVLLEGPLGAGKTSLARAILRRLSGTTTLDVPSPSFTLVQAYETPRGTVYHFDLWRLDGPGGVVELGWDEARDGIVLVEWPERLGGLRPPGATTIRIELGEGERRRAWIRPGRALGTR